MSPPYNVGFTPSEIGRKKKSKYQNDEDKRSSDDYLNLLTESTRNAMAFSEYSFVNVQSVSSNKLTLIDYLHEMKESFADVMIWDKEYSQPAMGENILNSDFEFVYVFSESATRRIGCKKFRGNVSNILHLSNRKGRDRKIQKIHSATFPIDFAAFFLKTFSMDSVLDLFGGSGTTLIAAEQLGRKCFMMELDPHYCDVIIARWEKLTGKIAILEQ